MAPVTMAAFPFSENISTVCENPVVLSAHQRADFRGVKAFQKFIGHLFQRFEHAVGVDGDFAQLSVIEHGMLHKPVQVVRGVDDLRDFVRAADVQDAVKLLPLMAGQLLQPLRQMVHLREGGVARHAAQHLLDKAGGIPLVQKLVRAAAIGDARPVQRVEDCAFIGRHGKRDAAIVAVVLQMVGFNDDWNHIGHSYDNL